MAGGLPRPLGDVSDAAAEAARAASMGNVTDIEAAAQDAASSALEVGGLLCQSVDVTTALRTVSGLQAVDVSVTCVLRLGDLAEIGVPGTQRVTGRHVAVIDQYRGGT